jgi:HSP20 family molecular chaperone IbpA
VDLHDDPVRSVSTIHVEVPGVAVHDIVVQSSSDNQILNLSLNRPDPFAGMGGDKITHELLYGKFSGAIKLSHLRHCSVGVPWLPLPNNQN